VEASAWERRGILMGVLAFILTVVGFIVAGSDSPYFLDSGQEIATYYTDDSGRIMAGSYIGLLGTAAFIWFLGELRNRMRRYENETGGRLSNIMFGGGLVASAMFLLVDLTNLAGAMRADEDGVIAPTTAATLYDVSSLALGAGAFGLGVAFIAVAVHALRTGMLPGWLAWVSVLIAIACLTPWSFIGAGVGLLWVLVVSILLYVRDAPAPAAKTPPPPAETPPPPIPAA
jgi:hypothetical protein